MEKFHNLTDALLTQDQIEAFLDECFSTDPDLKDEFETGDFRNVLHDTGGAGLCWDVCVELVKFLQRQGLLIGHSRLTNLDFPNPLYPNVDPDDVGPGNVNFVTLDSGICICLTEEEKLEVFSCRKGSASMRRVEDAGLSGDLTLHKDGGTALVSRGTKLFRMRMK